MNLLQYYPKYLYTRSLDLDLDQQFHNANKIRDHLIKSYSDLPPTYNGGSHVTKYYAYYNYLMMTLPGINKLYSAIKETFHAVNHHAHDGSPPHQEYYIQSWLNFYNKGEMIDWHGHMSGDGWHGFYCVNVEPDSHTEYRIDGQHIKIESKNNLLVIGKSERDDHRSSEWKLDEPRITIAFDINPVKNFNGCENIYNEQGRIHYWIPI